MKYLYEEGKIIAWHGSQNWTGIAEVRASNIKSQEYGPGLYVTNNIDTAKKYSKGSGKIIVLEIEKPRLLKLSNRVEIDEAEYFINSLYRAKNKKKTISEINNHQNDGTVSIISVMNLSSINGTTTGKNTLDLTDWIVSKGFDASLVASFGNEEWMTIFNPSIIKKNYKHKSEFDYFEMQKFSKQIEAIDLYDSINSISVKKNKTLKI